MHRPSGPGLRRWFLSNGNVLHLQDKVGRRKREELGWTCS